VLKHHNDPVALAGNGMLAATAILLGVIAARRSRSTENWPLSNRTSADSRQAIEGKWPMSWANNGQA
jgi:hypothetical protein